MRTQFLSVCDKNCVRAGRVIQGAGVGNQDSSKLRKRFKEALVRAGVRPIRFHDLRHTFGTRMAAAGAPLRSIQEWMGHNDYKTTEIYADYAPDPSQGAAWAKAAFDPKVEEGEEGRILD